MQIRNILLSSDIVMLLCFLPDVHMLSWSSEQDLQWRYGQLVLKLFAIFRFNFFVHFKTRLSINLLFYHCYCNMFIVWWLQIFLIVSVFYFYKLNVWCKRGVKNEYWSPDNRYWEIFFLAKIFLANNSQPNYWY